MNLRILQLPEPTPCAACQEPIDEIVVIPLLVGRDTTRVKAVVAACPNCGVGYELGIEAFARAATQEALKHISPEVPRYSAPLEN
jgi:hypothetical protein